MQVPAAYACLKRPVIVLGDYSIRSVQPQDIEDIRIWRNAQMDVLRQTAPITVEGQASYYQTRIWPTFSEDQPAQILFALLQAETRIGYGGLVHIAWAHRRAEVSFLVSPEIAADGASYADAMDAFFTLTKDLAFDDLELNRLTTETYSSRPDHIARYPALGFKEEGRLRQHVLVAGHYIDSILHGCVRSDER
jgi:RimJ/RimL family protein N-acetyltransferase